MKVRVKYGNRFVMVDVNYRDCPKRVCFRCGLYTHHNSVGYSGCSSSTATELSCLRRDNHGCPITKEMLSDGFKKGERVKK
jgi:hypothetical protein